MRVISVSAAADTWFTGAACVLLRTAISTIPPNGSGETARYWLTPPSKFGERVTSLPPSS